ncbi:PQ-loop domain-containing transporter [Desulfospira joergensenii]|uniref:PQ-loop domain-containing transporter n=1 Tax=Desulfospira joergensenii TaxID=53329 RepID=UPI0003B613C9|nr:PQ-loop domain-containing transporter [Desulfospira joergensenii]
MSISSILGMAGTLIGLVRALPQLLRLLRSREALGVSVDTAATSAIVGFGWAAYGILTEQPFVTLATGASAVVFLLIACFALQFRRQPAKIRIAPVWFFVLVTGFVFAKEAGLGMILPISILVSNTPQLYLAFKEEDLTDLSLGTWLFSVSDGLVWGGYSILEHDYSIMIFGLFQLSTSTMIVLLKLMNKRKIQNRFI